MKVRLIRLLFLFLSLTSIGAVLWTLSSPSEISSARVLGYSYARLALAGWCVFLALLFLIGFIYSILRESKASTLLLNFENWLLIGDRLSIALTLLFATALIMAWCLLFTWLFIPASLRPVVTWSLISTALLWLTLKMLYRKQLSARKKGNPYRSFPSINSLDKNQKQTLVTLFAVTMLTFLIFIPQNLQGTETLDAFNAEPSDEVVIYSILMDTLKPGDTFSATLYHIFIYEDYHYGYPFYALSQLVLLPVVWASKFLAADHTQINLLLLRQLTSVLPLLIAVFITVSLATRLKSAWKAVLLFAVIITAQGIYGYIVRFWHPDGLNALFVMLAIYFLSRDRLTFRQDFYIAAVFCGLSTATRLYGVFFFLSIAGYLIAGIIRKRNSFRQAALHGVGFIIVMTAVLLISSPYLFHSDARARMVEIMAEKGGEMRFGYNEPDPEGIYQTGWKVWMPFFNYYFAQTFFVIFMLFSMISGFLFSDRRLYYGIVIGWVLVLATYLVYFVAVKSNHYLIPLFVPMYGTVYGFSEAIRNKQMTLSLNRPQLAWSITTLVPAGFLFLQLILNVTGLVTLN